VLGAASRPRPRAAGDMTARLHLHLREPADISTSASALLHACTPGDPQGRVPPMQAIRAGRSCRTAARASGKPFSRTVRVVGHCFLAAKEKLDNRLIVGMVEMSATSSAHAVHAPVSFSSGAAAAYQVGLIPAPSAPAGSTAAGESRSCRRARHRLALLCRRTLLTRGPLRAGLGWLPATVRRHRVSASVAPAVRAGSAGRGLCCGAASGARPSPAEPIGKAAACAGEHGRPCHTDEPDGWESTRERRRHALADRGPRADGQDARLSTAGDAAQPEGTISSRGRRVAGRGLKHGAHCHWGQWLRNPLRRPAGRAAPAADQRRQRARCAADAHVEQEPDVERVLRSHARDWVR